jgi:hypothetical protein
LEKTTPVVRDAKHDGKIPNSVNVQCGRLSPYGTSCWRNTVRFNPVSFASTKLNMPTKTSKEEAKAYQDGLLEQLVRLDPASKGRVETVLDKPENKDDRISVDWNMCHVDCSITLVDASKLHERFLAGEFPFDQVSYILMKVLIQKRAVSYVVAFIH